MKPWQIVSSMRVSRYLSTSRNNFHSLPVSAICPLRVGTHNARSVSLITHMDLLTVYAALELECNQLFTSVYQRSLFQCYSSLADWTASFVPLVNRWHN